MAEQNLRNRESQIDWFALAQQAFHPHGGLLVAVDAAAGDKGAQEAILHTLNFEEDSP